MINFHEIDNLKFMEKVPDKFYSWAIVDPEWGIDITNQSMGSNSKNSLANNKKYNKKNWDKKPPPKKYFDELFRISENQIIWGVDYFDLPNIGNGRIKWNKLKPKGISFNNFEIAYCSAIETEIEFKYLWNGMQQGISLMNPEKQQGNHKLKEKKIHPTHKPINLYLWIMINFLKKGDNIIDTNGGGMSIAIAADKLGYDLDVCENDPEYFKLGTAAYSNYKQQLTLF